MTVNIYSVSVSHGTCFDQAPLGGQTCRIWQVMRPAGTGLKQALDGAARGRWGHGLECQAAAPMDARSLSSRIARKPLGLAGILLARGWAQKRAGAAPHIIK
jgi:hypothetical protein